ncbi:hypothetical protein [Nocardia amikacinitolerans]|uniref:hypothetical protein n=1 Tax=Nocardia amikacinitolerans TaxID=756689 RepID=UPI0026CDAC37
MHEHAPLVGAAPYCAAKAGLGALTKVLALELAGLNPAERSAVPLCRTRSANSQPELFLKPGSAHKISAMTKLAHRRITFFAGAVIAAVLPVTGAGYASADPATDAYLQAAKEACESAGYQLNSSLAAAGFRSPKAPCVDPRTLAVVRVPVADGTACSILDGVVTREGTAFDGVCR